MITLSNFSKVSTFNQNMFYSKVTVTSHISGYIFTIHSVQLERQEKYPGKDYQIRLHMNAQRSSFGIDFKSILEFGLKDTRISRISRARLQF